MVYNADSMAVQGICFQLTDKDKKFAIKYVEKSGFYKSRLADFLSISRPTLDKLLEEDNDFFTSLKRADAIFCKNLIEEVSRKNPAFILKTKYRKEFDDTLTIVVDPEEELKRIHRLIYGNSPDDDSLRSSTT